MKRMAFRPIPTPSLAESAGSPTQHWRSLEKRFFQPWKRAWIYILIGTESLRAAHTTKKMTPTIETRS
jgi:hypothetical protein